MPKQIFAIGSTSLFYEYAEYSIDDYLSSKGIPNKLSFQDVLV